MKRKRRKKVENPAISESLAPASVPPWRLNRGWCHAAILAGLFFANLALYYRTVSLGFLSVDDPDYVQNNPYIERIDTTNITHLLTTPYFANYAPLNIL